MAPRPFVDGAKRFIDGYLINMVISVRQLELRGSAWQAR
jgi:hypothetical protein